MSNKGGWWKRGCTQLGELEVYPERAYLPRVTLISEVEPNIRTDLHRTNEAYSTVVLCSRVWGLQNDKLESIYNITYKQRNTIIRTKRIQISHWRH